MVMVALVIMCDPEIVSLCFVTQLQADLILPSCYILLQMAASQHLTFSAMALFLLLYVTCEAKGLY